MLYRISNLVLCVAVGSVALADWPQFNGPDRNSVSTEKGLLNEWGDSGPEVLWTVDVGVGFGGAAIDGDEVFILDRVNDAQDVLRCFNLKSGEELWKVSYDAQGRSGFNGSRTVPAVTDTHVITSGPFGHLSGIDRKSHEIVWTKNIIEPGAKTPPWAMAQNPLLYGDVVIIAAFGSSGGLVAYEQNTGEEKWRTSGVSGPAYCSPAVISLGGKQQVTLVNDQGVVAVDPENGKLMWRFTGYKCSIPIPNVTPVGEDKLFVTGGYKAGSVLIEVSRDEKPVAKELWRIPQGSQIHQPVVIGNAIIFNGNTNETQDNIICIDARDGKVAWQVPQPKLDRANILMADKKLFYIAGDGTLNMSEPTEKGVNPLGSSKLLGGKEIWAPIALSDGVMVIRDQKQMKAVKVK